ncbi:Heparinase II/III-like protein [Burkholderiales bacterium JOSHI_001]|nr:Heparinase II/III-like protein [Burkholderiales bacterium JOSHI_001]
MTWTRVPLAASLQLVGPLLLLAAIWWPEWAHYRIDRSADWNPVMVMAASAPEHRRNLEELGAIDLAESSSYAITPNDAALAVESGTLQVPRLSQGLWPLRGYPADIQQGPPTFRLFMASLSLERLLLVAWRNTGQERWLRTALNRIEQFAAHEASKRHDRGFLWNDHAVAGRASPLILAWLALEQHPELKAAHAPALLGLVQRTGRMLAKADQFTVRTNHGVMQNLALLQLAAAFPLLPESGDWRELADQRLRLQLGFYVSPEGVVLEHSPGYHFMGTQLLAWAQRLRQLNGLPADPLLEAARAGTTAVLADLLRPDGTLPAIGNTDGHTPHAMVAGPAVTTANSAERIYPASGWGIWWSDRAGSNGSQTVFTWAYHLGHGHKHADEGAFTWWAAGLTWITGVGYWPYGEPLVRKTYDWPGANALHGRSEGPTSTRESRLLAQGAADGLRAADMERIRADGARLRRTLVQVDPATLLVLDFHEDVSDGVATYWTFGPELRLHPSAAANAWTSEPRQDGLSLTMALDSTANPSTSSAFPVQGLAAGWTTVQRQPRQVTTVKVATEDARGATATLFHLVHTPGAGAHVVLAPGARPEQWKVQISWDKTSRQVERSASLLRLTDGATPPAGLPALSLSLQPVQAVPTQAALRAAYATAVRRYPPWRDLWDYRVNAGWWVLVLALALEAGRRMLHRLPPKAGLRWARWEPVTVAGCWLVSATFLLAVYLRV